MATFVLVPGAGGAGEVYWRAAGAEMEARGHTALPVPFGQPCTFETWPAVPIHVLIGADDRMFPAEFQMRIARDRLGVEADVMPGGHLMARSRPVELAERLVANPYRRGLDVVVEGTAELVTDRAVRPAKVLSFARGEGFVQTRYRP